MAIKELNMHYVIKAITLSVAVLTSQLNYAQETEVTVLSDIAYGLEPKQSLDVYIPAKAGGAPVIFMVHGGGWAGGDKANSNEFESKVEHWVNNGFVFISTNYRTLPEADPITQMQDVKSALLFAQQNVKEWGGDPSEFILIGHSSGAHLTSLLATTYRSDEAFTDNPFRPLIGAISLDSSAFNIVARLTEKEPSARYQTVFGEDVDYWKKASPAYSVSKKLPPFMAVCSTRSETACKEAEKFQVKSEAVGANVTITAVDMSHQELNGQLGLPSCYTKMIDDFIKELSPKVKFTYLKSDALMAKQDCSVP